MTAPRFIHTEPPLRFSGTLNKIHRMRGQLWDKIQAMETAKSGRGLELRKSAVEAAGRMGMERRARMRLLYGHAAMTADLVVDAMERVGGRRLGEGEKKPIWDKNYTSALWNYIRNGRPEDGWMRERPEAERQRLWEEEQKAMWEHAVEAHRKEGKVGDG